MPDLKNRLTVVENVYHQIPGHEPDCVQSTFVRELESDEQPYRRLTKVDEEWQPLDLGWVQDIGMLHISNDESKNQTVIPSDEEKAELAKKILEVTYNTNPEADEECWIILPGESMRANPAYPKNLFIRSQSGVTQFTVYIIPK